jgi:hypothetical protein
MRMTGAPSSREMTGAEILLQKYSVTNVVGPRYHRVLATAHGHREDPLACSTIIASLLGLAYATQGWLVPNRPRLVVRALCAT